MCGEALALDLPEWKVTREWREVLAYRGCWAALSHVYAAEAEPHSHRLADRPCRARSRSASWTFLPSKSAAVVVWPVLPALMLRQT